MALINLALLGGFRARLGPGPALTLPTRKAQAVLAYLAVPLGQAHPRDKVAALLWGDRSEKQARKSLRQTLFILRKALADQTSAWLHLDGGALALNPAAVDVDVSRFEHRLAEGTPAALAEAVTLYQGDLLQGLAVEEPLFEEWLMLERERLREAALEGLARLLAHQRRAGANEAAVQTGRRLLALDPLQEPCHRALMQLYTRLGRRDAALRQYQQCVDVLQRELHADPEPETSALYQAILQQRAHPVLIPAGPRDGSGALPLLRPTSPTHAPAPAEAPLVGRGPELARLRAAWETARDGRGGGVAIVGEAGIGKTRLAVELATEAVRQGDQVLLGRSYETEQILPFGPWVDALRAGEVTRDEALLAGLAPVWRTELGRLVPEVLAPGVPRPAEPAEYLQLFESLSQLLQRLAGRRPVLLIMEDLQWADDMSIRLLAYLGRRVQALPLLIVGTVREEELADATLLRRTLENLTQDQALVRLTLEPLAPSDMLTLVSGLTGAGAETKALTPLQICAASEGNPFVAIELVRALRAGTLPTEPAGLPLSVREAITGRLERLSAPAQHAAAVAAVIGRAAEFPLLARAAGLDEVRTAEAVEELVRFGVLQAVGDRLDFSHDRMRAIVAARLLPLRRTLLHRRAAEALEALHGDLEPHRLAIGLHYREAEVWDRAAPALHRAGILALARSAPREATAAFDQALDALQHLPESRARTEQAIDLHLDASGAVVATGGWAKGTDHVREAETLAEALGDERRLGWALGRLADHAGNAGDSDRALELSQRALAIAIRHDDVSLQTSSNHRLGVVWLARGDYRQAVERLSRVAETRQGDRLLSSGALASVSARERLAWSFAELGEFVEAMACAEEAARIAREVDQPRSLVYAHRSLGLVPLRRGDLVQAIPPLERAVELCRAIPAQVLFDIAAAHLGYAYALSGRLSEGVALTEAALAEPTVTGTTNHPLFLAYLGEAHLLAGRPGDALAVARRALDLAHQQKEHGNEAWVLRLLGEIAAQVDPPDLESAGEHYAWALGRANDLGMRLLVAHCHLGLGKLYRRVGEGIETHEHLATASMMYREMGMTVWLEKAEAALQLPLRNER